MQNTEQSYNLQYLQLQSQMQRENRAYTATSNIMKTYRKEHDQECKMIVRSTKFALVINLKIAKVLRVTVPLPLLGPSDKVIE